MLIASAYTTPLQPDNIFLLSARYENIHSPEASVVVEPTMTSSKLSSKFNVCASSQRYAIEQGERSFINDVTRIYSLLLGHYEFSLGKSIPNAAIPILLLL